MTGNSTMSSVTIKRISARVYQNENSLNDQKRNCSVKVHVYPELVWMLMNCFPKELLNSHRA